MSLIAAIPWSQRLHNLRGHRIHLLIGHDAVTHDTRAQVLAGLGTLIGSPQP